MLQVNQLRLKQNVQRPFAKIIAAKAALSTERAKLVELSAKRDKLTMNTRLFKQPSITT